MSCLLLSVQTFSGLRLVPPRGRTHCQPQHLQQSSSSSSPSSPPTNDLVPLPSPSSPLLTDNRPVVKWEASSHGSVRVTEIKRSVEDYMALPASQYSVLSADQVTRLNDTDFKIALSKLNFFGTHLRPLLYVKVFVQPEIARSDILVDHAELESDDPIVQAINNRFSIHVLNIVTAGVDKKGRKTLNSNTTLSIEAKVPATGRISLPLGMIQKGGQLILQSTLAIIVPTFLRILAADFKRWSAGDDNRGAVEGARLDLPGSSNGSDNRSGNEDARNAFQESSD
eukprot:gene2399-2631_t